MAYQEKIYELAKENTDFRRVLYTGENSQLVLMSIPPEGEIGEEIHNDVDQILFFVSGRGESIIEGESEPLEEGDAVFVPAGTRHNFRNVDLDDDLKLFTVYSPPNHPENTIHATKEEADIEE